jgi:uncharacterized protein (TIGR00725 family)
MNQPYKIAVSGSAEGVCESCGYQKAYEVGREIAKKGAILVNGATTGIPLAAAKGAKSANGFVVGFSPAISKKEHIKKYHLPLKYLDFVVYTGFNYSGRNLILTRSADAVIVVCGRMGTLNEFTAAFEDGKIIGVLLHSGGVSDEIEKIIKIAKKGRGRVIFDDDPKRLVEKVIEAILEDERINFHGKAS